MTADWNFGIDHGWGWGGPYHGTAIDAMMLFDVVA